MNMNEMVGWPPMRGGPEDEEEEGEFDMRNVRSSDYACFYEVQIDGVELVLVVPVFRFTREQAIQTIRKALKLINAKEQA